MASKPILLTVDDDPEVLRAIERDLRRHYGRNYRVLRADAGASALDVLRQVDARGEPVALFLVDQRMPPDVRRGVPTGYVDRKNDREGWPGLSHHLALKTLAGTSDPAGH